MDKTKRKKRRKTVLIIILCVLLVLGIGGYKLYQTGMSGNGPLAALLYLQSPIALTDTQYEVEVSTLELENDGQTIIGTLFLPKDGRNTREVLIFSHGFNCQSQLLANKATSLAQSGIATVTFDFRGGSLRGQSEGEMTDMTYLTEISDLNCVIETVKGFDWVDPDKIFLMGESQGGLITALTASQRDDISSIVLCFPALHVADTARSFWSSKDQIPETVDVNGATTGRAYWEAFYDLDVYEEITKYPGNVLLLHGTADQMVPYTYSVKANELYENSRLVIIEGAGHGFGGDDGASSLKTIYYYLQQEITR